MLRYVMVPFHANGCRYTTTWCLIWNSATSGKIFLLSIYNIYRSKIVNCYNKSWHITNQQILINLPINASIQFSMAHYIMYYHHPGFYRHNTRTLRSTTDLNLMCVCLHSDGFWDIYHILDTKTSIKIVPWMTEK